MKEHFGDVLAHYVARMELTAGRLAKVTGISASTIESWLEGRVRHPRRWQDIVSLAAALRLTEEEANRLLQSAKSPTVTELLADAKRKEDTTTLALVSYWLEQRERGPEQPQLPLANGAPTANGAVHLPLTGVPSPGMLPVGSRLPIIANPLFVGRQAEMLALANALAGDTFAGAGRTVVLTGLGGIGKTQLAVEFAHRYGRFFTGGVFWINFLDPAAISQQIATCGDAQHMNLHPDFDELSPAKQVKLVQRAWQEPVSRLLIFDACEEELPLHQWRDPAGGCRIIVTSRRGRWSPALGVKTLPLSPLPHGESQQLLQRFRHDLARSEAVAIAAELGHLPLALHLAGSFLRTYRHDIASACYLAELQQLRGKKLLRHPSLQGRGVDFSPTGQALHVDRTIALSYEKLDPEQERDRLALALLTRAARLLPGEPIPRQLIAAIVPAIEQDKLHIADALARLVNLGLVNEGEGGSIQVHQLVAAFAQDVVWDQTAQTDVEETVQTALCNVEETLDPSPLQTWEPHLRHVADSALCREDVKVAQLAHYFAIYLWLSGLYDEAEAYCRQTLAIRKKSLDTSHLDTAESLDLLGLVLKYKGHYGAAQRCYEEALAIREDVLGMAHQLTAKSLNNLGALLQATEDYDGARTCYERALAIKERILGPEHQGTGTTLSNLGTLLILMEDYEEALQILERVLVIDEMVFGPEHPRVGSDLSNLGRLLRENGRYQEAYTCLERGLAILEKKLGSEHSITANARHQLGVLNFATGKLETAQQFIKQALAIKRKQLDSNHPDIAVILESLADIQLAKGNLPQAIRCEEEAASILAERHGPEHKKTQLALERIRRMQQRDSHLQ